MSEAYPFIGTAERGDAAQLPVFKEYAWDFEKDCFRYDKRGRHILVQENETMKVWIYKALKTERFSYLAYSWQYDIELEPFVGKVMGVQERKSELKRMIVECLMVNPYIQSIDSVTFAASAHGETLQVTVILTTVYGKVEVYV